MKLAAAFLESYAQAQPGDTVETMDLFTAGIQPFEINAARGRYTMLRGAEHTPEEAAAWGRVLDTIAHFKTFDKYVITTPMWNFNIPWALKLYLDTLLQPGQTFGFDPEKGFFGLMEGKPVQLLITRTGMYAPGTPGEAIDFQLPYLKFILGFMGLDLKSYVIAQPLDLMGPEVGAEALATAIEEAKAAGLAF